MKLMTIFILLSSLTNDISAETSAVTDIISKVIIETYQIRKIVGKKGPNPLKFKVKNASLRELYFQSYTLLKKADRICFDYTASVGEVLPTRKVKEIKEKDLTEILNVTLKRLKCTRVVIGKSYSKSVLTHKCLSLDRCYIYIVQLNRQLNILLDNPYRPSTVFTNVEIAIDYTLRILKDNFRNTLIPSASVYYANKRPVDVYKILLKSLFITNKIILSLGDSPILFDVINLGKFIVPGDVFDLASLIVSQLQYIESRISKDNIRQIKSKNYPGRKFPSHVLEKATRLNELLAILEGQKLEVEK